MLVPFPDLFVLSFYSQTLVGKAIIVAIDGGNNDAFLPSGG
jgi:hypothetical protein